MFADPKKVAGRRFRRRVKAGAAVVLAMVAGAFLACKGTDDTQQPPSPMGPDARRGPGPQDVDGGSSVDAADASDATTDATDAVTDAGGDAAGDAAGDAPEDAARDASTTLMVRDASVDAAAKAPRVDKHEHRKGMPVRDNLLE